MPEYVIRGGTAYRVITDHLGSPRIIIDVNTGVIIQRVDYDEFGNVLFDSNPDFTPFGFAGGLYDSDVGLTRFGFRDYDPVIGRWTAKDPRGFRGGSMNLYSYVGNDPINNIDPAGLWTPAAHEKLLKDALQGKGIRPDYVNILISSSELLDAETGMAIKYAPMHSMRRPFQKPADAIREREQFICNNLRLAKIFADWGDDGMALHFLGVALHPIMDSFSPEHVDESGNPRVWPAPSLAVPPFIWHPLGEGVGDINDLPAESRAELNKQIYGAYTYVFGK